MAEMKLPGRAWLEFEVVEDSSGSRIRQTAIFDPVGLSGLLYWYALYPVHQCVFGDMLRGIVKACRNSEHGFSRSAVVCNERRPCTARFVTCLIKGPHASSTASGISNESTP